MEGNWRSRPASGDAPAPSSITREEPIPPECIGLVIGRGGSNIRRMTDVTGIFNVRVESKRQVPVLAIKAESADAIKRVLGILDDILQKPPPTSGPVKPVGSGATKEALIRETIQLNELVGAFILGSEPSGRRVDSLRHLPGIKTVRFFNPQFGDPYKDLKNLDVEAFSSDAMENLKEKVKCYKEEFSSFAFRDIYLTTSPDRSEFNALFRELEALPGIVNVRKHGIRFVVIGDAETSLDAAEALINKRFAVPIIVERKVPVPPELCGYIIGKKGSKIRNLKNMDGIGLVNLDVAGGYLEIGGRSEAALDAVQQHVEEDIERFYDFETTKRPCSFHAEIYVPNELESYIIGPKGSTIERFRDMDGIEYAKYSRTNSSLQIGSNSESELNACREQIQLHLDDYDPQLTPVWSPRLRICDLRIVGNQPLPRSGSHFKRADKVEFGEYKHERRMKIPVGCESYIIGPKGACIRDLERIPGILRVVLCDESQSILIGGDDAKAVDEVERRVLDKISERNQNQIIAGTLTPFTKSLPIPDSIILFSIEGIKELQSTPGILFIKVKEGIAKIGGDVADVVEDVCIKIKDILSKYNLNAQVTSKQIHYDITAQFSGRMSFYPIHESGLVDFTAFLPLVKVENPDVNFFNFREDQQSVIPCVLDPSYGGQVKHCFFDMDIMTEKIREILAGNSFRQSGTPRIEVKLGLTAFYNISQSNSIRNEDTLWADTEREEDTVTLECEQQWNYKTQFSGSLKIPLSVLKPVLEASEFEEQGTETHTTVHIRDQKTATAYTATLVEEGDTMKITSLQERKTKHLTVDIVKPEGKIAVRIVLLSENPVESKSAEAFLTSAWEAGWLLDDTDLTSDRNFGVQDVRVVKNTVFWDGEYGLYLEEVEEKATHTRGRFVNGIEMVLTRPDLNKSLTGLQDGRLSEVEQWCKMFRKIVEKSNALAEQIQK